MTASRRLLTTLLVPAVGLLAACGHDEAELARAEREPVRVSVTTVERVIGPAAVQVRGVVQPARRSTVSTRVSGPVVSLSVAAGDRVRRGDPLVEIQPEAAEGQLSQAKGALAQAQAALALAQRNHARYQALHAEKAVSDAELDMATMQLDQARGAVRQAEGAVTTAATIADDAVVRAPFDARVVNTLVELGDLAAPGRPLVEVESLAAREIWLTVRAADVSRIASGQRLEVRIDSRPDLGTVPGVVTEVVPSADPATHTFTVKVRLEGVDIPSGLTGRAMIAGESSDRLVVPASAVHRRGGLELVVVRAEDGTSRTRAVTTGVAVAGDRVEILSGVAEGESVVIDAPAPPPEGTPLEVAS